jgi:hypothetical protein
MKKFTVTDLKTERAELAAQQELLLESLMAQGDHPAEIEKKQIMATASSLFRKRANYISRCLPNLAEDATYFDKMQEYVVQHPGSHPDGICRDAAQFSRFFRSRKFESKLQPTFDHIFIFFRNFLSPALLLNKVLDHKAVDK